MIRHVGDVSERTVCVAAHFVINSLRRFVAVKKLLKGGVYFCAAFFGAVPALGK
jgi:hypothetical protein